MPALLSVREHRQSPTMYTMLHVQYWAVLYKGGTLMYLHANSPNFYYKSTLYQ